MWSAEAILEVLHLSNDYFMQIIVSVKDAGVALPLAPACGRLRHNFEQSRQNRQ